MHNGKKRHNLAIYIEYHCVNLRCSNKSGLLYSMVQRMRSKLLSPHYYWGEGVNVRVPRYHGDWHEADSITWSEWDLNSVHPQSFGRRLLYRTLAEDLGREWGCSRFQLPWSPQCKKLITSIQIWRKLNNRLLHASATLASPPTKKSMKLNNKRVYN